MQEAVETAQQTSTTHTLTMQGSIQRSVLGDSDRLMQVFMNLLSNAIKYSPQATKVEVFIEERGDDVHIHVRDYGLGIAKEHQERIFDSFYRINDGNRVSIQGLGMGLYIACEIIKRHGGDITVDSEEGIGTTFSVVLPLMTENVIEKA